MADLKLIGEIKGFILKIKSSHSVFIFTFLLNINDALWSAKVVFAV